MVLSSHGFFLVFLVVSVGALADDECMSSSGDEAVHLQVASSAVTMSGSMDSPQTNCGNHMAWNCASCPQCGGDCKWESNSNQQGGNCVDKCPMWACDGCSGSQCTSCRENEKVKCCFEEKCKGCGGEQCQHCKQEKCCSSEFSWVSECQTPAPPPPQCDLSACNGCSGSQCSSCRADEEVKCCFEDKCKGCSGSQCHTCKHDRCCSGEFGWAPECQMPTSPPACDLAACDGCAGSQCTTCRENEKVKCCFEDNCKGCSGSQCHTCKHDRCCSGEFGWVPECQSAPSPTCHVGESVQCPGSSAHCAGNQCCPGKTAASNNFDFPCPSAAEGFDGCPWPYKVEDCTKR